MTLPLRKVEMPPSPWRQALAEIGPQLAQEDSHGDTTGKYVAANMAKLRERGFLELGVPAELGGGGLSRTELADMLRELAHYCSSTALVLSMHTHLVAAAAWRWQRQKAPTDGLLKRIAKERIQLLSSGGSDWLKGSGKAVKVEGGYRVNARKVFASGAQSAQLFMTMAIDENAADGPTVLHLGVPMNADGISIKETWDSLGMRGTGSHDVVMKDVFVPDAAVGGKRKPGVWHPLMEIVTLVAFPLVYSVYTGVAEAARNIAVGMAAEKHDPTVFELIGELETELAAARIALASMVALGEDAMPGPETSNTIFIHRALVGRSVLKTLDLALEIAGGTGFFRRNGLERLFRDGQGARFHPLTGVPQRRFAGRMALGLPVDEAA